MTTHELKSWPTVFDAVKQGIKGFEARRNDRHFAVGDRLLLREWCPQTKNYSGHTLLLEVTYLLNGPSFGIETGYCVMSVRPVLREIKP